MNKELIRAYFRAYRARINVLEEEVGNLCYSLDEAEAAHSRLSRNLRNAESEFDRQLRDEKYERWSLEDRVKKLERMS